MHPRVRELIDYLDRERAYLDEAIAGIPAAYSNVKPAPDEWCIAEVVHHLAIMDQRIGALISAGIAEARASGVAPDPVTEPILPKIRTSHVMDRTRKFRNPRGDPPHWLPLDDAIAAFDQARRAFKAMLVADDLPDLSKVNGPHPIFGNLTGYEWVAFTAAHTHRHADQIKEIGLWLREPRGN